MLLWRVIASFGIFDVKQQLLGKRVYFDVNVFIYALEPTQQMQDYFATVAKLFEMAGSKRNHCYNQRIDISGSFGGRIQKQSAISCFI